MFVILKEKLVLEFHQHEIVVASDGKTDLRCQGLVKMEDVLDDNVVPLLWTNA
jgi:hypothetical protein